MPISGRVLFLNALCRISNREYVVQRKWTVSPSGLAVHFLIYSAWAGQKTSDNSEWLGLPDGSKALQRQRRNSRLYQLCVRYDVGRNHADQSRQLSYSTKSTEGLHGNLIHDSNCGLSLCSHFAQDLPALLWNKILDKWEPVKEHQQSHTWHLQFLRSA